MEEAQAGFELRVAERVTTLERRCEAGEKAVHAAVAALAAAAIAAAASDAATAAAFAHGITAQLSRRPWVRCRYLQSGDRDGQHSMLPGRRPRLIFVSSQPFASRRRPSPTCHWTARRDGSRRCVCERRGISLPGPRLPSMHGLRAPARYEVGRRLLYRLRLQPPEIHPLDLGGVQPAAGPTAINPSVAAITGTDPSPRRAST